MAVLFASALRTPAAYTSDIVLPPSARGFLIAVNKTAEGGATSTFVASFQFRNTLVGAWKDLKLGASGAAVAMDGTLLDAGATADDDLMIFPELTEKVTGGNRRYSSPCPRKLQMTVTIGTASVTFSALALPLY
jgi:hypothetical protein